LHGKDLGIARCRQGLAYPDIRTYLYIGSSHGYENLSITVPASDRCSAHCIEIHL
jgi:hypothetical protein